MLRIVSCGTFLHVRMRKRTLRMVAGTVLHGAVRCGTTLRRVPCTFLHVRIRNRTLQMVAGTVLHGAVRNRTLRMVICTFLHVRMRNRTLR